MRLKCSINKKSGCPWSIEDEAYDSLGQLIEHEKECSIFQQRRRDADYIADRLSIERVFHLVEKTA